LGKPRGCQQKKNKAGGCWGKGFPTRKNKGGKSWLLGGEVQALEKKQGATLPLHGTKTGEKE